MIISVLCIEKTIKMKKNLNLGLLIIRLTIGILMLLHGIGKLSGGLDFIEGLLAQKGLPTFFAYGVYIGEIIIPVLLIIGYRTRLASLIFAFNCFVAILLVHTADIFTINDYGGWGIELIGIYLFIGIALFYTGGGRYALSKSNKWD